MALKDLKSIPKMFQNLGIWQRFCPDFCQAEPSPEKSALLDIGGFFGWAKSRDKIEAENQILEYFGYKCLFFGICLISSIVPFDGHSTTPTYASAQPADLLLDKIYAVHATRVLPGADYLQTGLNTEDGNDFQKMMLSNARQTLHFSLGELVRPVDGFISWEDCPYAIVTPLRKLLPQLLNINCYDTFILGDLPLDSDTFLFLPNELADKVESQATLIIYDTKCKTLREAIDEFILSNDAWPIQMNEDDIEDELHEAYMDGININTLDFFKEIKERNPWLSVGLRFEPLDGEHYRLSQIEQSLIFIMMQLLSPSYEGTVSRQLDTCYLEESLKDVNEHFEKWSQSLKGFNWCEQSQKAYRQLAMEVEKLTSLILEELRIREVYGKTLKSAPDDFLLVAQDYYTQNISKFGHTDLLNTFKAEGSN